MARIALDRIHEVRDEVIPAFELDVDITPGFVHSVLEPHQAIVQGDKPLHDHCQHNQYDKSCSHTP